MKITVLWEDQRGANAKGFGPHELLVSCVADELRCQRYLVKRYVDSNPKKGNGGVMRALKQDLSKLSRSGLVCAVLDRDQVLNLWPGSQRPATCLSGIRAAVFASAPGDYELILLHRNIEFLVEACCGAIGIATPDSKPSPNERDLLLGKAIWGAENVRAHVRRDVPSFDRLVRWVAKNVPATSPG